MKRSTFFDLIWSILIIGSISFFIFLFWRATGNHISLLIDTPAWAHFGAFMSAFLLAITLLIQIRASRRQQIEAKFFELIRYYRDNINEMTFSNPFAYTNEKGDDFEQKHLSGRRVIKTIFLQYVVASCYVEQFEVPKSYKPGFSLNFDKVYEFKKPEFSKEYWNKNIWRNHLAYMITFWGVPGDSDIELKKYIKNLLSKEDLELLIIALKHLPVVNSMPVRYRKSYSGYINSKTIKIDYKLINSSEINSSIKFFGGHQYHLGHYFRHFYQAVKYIDNQDWYIISNRQKKEYIKTLRAQLSNYEQALLFINSLSPLGSDWEYDDPRRNLITKYKLIKNLPESFVPNMNPNHYYPKIQFEWLKKNKGNSR